MGLFDRLRKPPPEPEWIDVGTIGAEDSYAKLRARADQILRTRHQSGSVPTIVNVIEPSPGFAEQNVAQFRSHVLETLAAMLPSLSEKARSAVGRGSVLFLHGRTGETQRTVALVVLG